MKRLVFLSYDASEEFKAEYEKQKQKQFDYKELWVAIENLGGKSKVVHIKNKPVESTIIIETDEYPDHYSAIASLIRREFPGLNFVIGLVCQISGIDMITSEPSIKSEKDMKIFLEDYNKRHMTTFKEKKNN